MPGIKSFTIEQKLEVIDRVKNKFGSRLHRASRAFEIDQKCLRAWIDKENMFLNVKSRRHKRQVENSGREASSTELEEPLFLWFEQQRAKKLIVNYKRLRVEAKKFAATSSW